MSMVNLYILNVVVMKLDKTRLDFEAKFHPFTPMFDPQRDVQAVEPNLAIDIAEVYRTGVVPNSAPAFVDRYNDCPEPDAIIGRPRNDFETDRMISAVNAGIREASESKAE